MAWQAHRSGLALTSPLAEASGDGTQHPAIGATVTSQLLLILTNLRSLHPIFFIVDRSKSKSTTSRHDRLKHALPRRSRA
jgi:hypothetical protein